jgi:hypothetical protein
VTAWTPGSAWTDGSKRKDVGTQDLLALVDRTEKMILKEAVD